jgi:hypothetical protein
VRAVLLRTGKGKAFLRYTILGFSAARICSVVFPYIWFYDFFSKLRFRRQASAVYIPLRSLHLGDMD